MEAERERLTPSSDGLSITGPYTNGNHAIWLVHGTDRSKGRNYLTVAEAVAQANGGAGEGVALLSARSPTSFQLTLETEALRRLTEQQRVEVLPLPQGKPDVVGYVYAVNGEICGGNVYASPALFGKLWPALLDAAIVEAVAERSPTTQPSLPSRDKVAAKLATPSKAAASRQVNSRTIVRTCDVGDGVLLQTDDVEAGVPVSRSLLAKPEVPPLR